MNGAALVSLIVLLAAALLAAATLYIYAYTQPYADTFCPGTFLSGYPLSGMKQEEAKAQLAQMTDEKISAWSYALTWQGETYTLTAEDIALHVDAEKTLAPLWQAGRADGMARRFIAMLALRSEPVMSEPVLAYSMEPVDALLAQLESAINSNPVDATVTFTPGLSEPFSFTDEEAGLTLETAPLRSAIEASILTLEADETAIEPKSTAPSVRRAELENAISLRARVRINLASDEAGVQNAMLAAQALNGLCVQPGETLSFNDVVGARTAEDGYAVAEEPAYGEGISGVGGGVCQASTALYQAALLAGLEVTQRSAAVYPVSYCEMGQEAAVSDQGLDLVIRNQTESPLFIVTRVYDAEENAVLEVQIIGEELGARYTLETQALETESITEPVYVRDREGRYAVYTDERVPVGEGKPGYSALVERVTLDEDENEIARETISEDSYDPIAPTVYVGVTER